MLLRSLASRHQKALHPIRGLSHRGPASSGTRGTIGPGMKPVSHGHARAHANLREPSLWRSYSSSLTLPSQPHASRLHLGPEHIVASRAFVSAWNATSKAIQGQTVQCPKTFCTQALRETTSRKAMPSMALGPPQLQKVATLCPAAHSWKHVRRFTGGGIRSAVVQRVSGIWQRNKQLVVGICAAGAIFYIWRATFGLASMFIDLTESFAEAGFLALSVALVMMAYMFYRSRSTISPSRLHHMAMHRINTSPAVIEVMGAPVVGSKLQANVVSGGGIRFSLKSKSFFGLKFRSKRLHMIFPVSGPEARGVVSIEAKRRRGKHAFKLLTLDIVPHPSQPAAAPSEAPVAAQVHPHPRRIFLEGDDARYRKGGILSELRDPFLRVAEAQTSYEIEDDEDERSATTTTTTANSTDASPSPSGLTSASTSAHATRSPREVHGRSMYFYEWLWEKAAERVTSNRKIANQKRVDKI